MAKSTLKKLRLVAGMTQTEVAEAMGMSQPNYQRWEAGSAPVPEGKLKKLAHILKVSVDEVLGKPAAFDLFGIDDKISDAQTYFGEVAVHFANKGTMLLPVSKAMRSSLHHQFQSRSAFIVAESLDNRIVFIRREAVTDIYFSSEAFDTYGPEEYTDHMGVLPDDNFWQIVEHMDFSEVVEDEFDEGEIERVLSQVRLTDADIEKLVSSGEIAAEDREKVKEKAAEETKKYYDRATCICWQLSSGPLRCEHAFKNRMVFEAFSLMEIDPDDTEDVIYLPIEGYNRSILIRKSEVNFISLPKHKFNAGSIESAEEELDAA